MTPLVIVITICAYFLFLMGIAQLTKGKADNAAFFSGNKDSKWYTMCVNKGLDPIYTKIYLSPEKDWKRIKDMLPEYKDVLDLFDDCVDSNLSKMNSNIIFKIKDILNIKTKIIFDYPTELKGTERLVDICLKNGAKTYISGVSGSKYMDINKFSDNNIKVIFQDETKMVKKPIIDILKNKLLNV
mgnify:CR=1 FL=1